MVTRAEIVATARTYLGTPFMHQGRMRGVGIDCAGLVICVAYDLGLADVRITGYSRFPDETVFRATLHEHMQAIQYQELLIGDVLTFRFTAEQHLAIVTNIAPLTMIHSAQSAGKCVEHAVDSKWLNRLRGCYRYHGVE